MQEKKPKYTAWEEALERSASRFHLIGAWVAIIFDPIFGITDYLNIAEWKHLLFIRFAVSGITGLTLYMRKKLQLPSYVVVFVPFLLISLQNAYTFRFITQDAVLGHSLNYMALLIGAGMFILWRIGYSLFMVGLSMAATILFFYLNPALEAEETLVNGGLLLAMVAIFMVVLIQTRYRLTVKTIKAQLALEAQKEKTEQKNKHIMDSIRYAERIQKATLPPLKEIQTHLPESFVFFEPRDVVSGDFYWFSRRNDQLFLAVMDCTGHGVPGAFLAMKGDALLNQLVNEEEFTDPGEVLSLMHKAIYVGLKQEETQNRDGMDGVFVRIDLSEKALYFAGAKNPLYFVQNDEMHQIKGDKFPIGSAKQGEVQRQFKTHTLSFKAHPITAYLFTDGYQDQFGGPKGLKFMKKRFREMLHANHKLPMSTQQEALAQTFHDWLGNGRQIDDVTVAGLRLA